MDRVIGPADNHESMVQVQGDPVEQASENDDTDELSEISNFLQQQMQGCITML